MGQHVRLEPLGIQAFFPLHLHVSTFTLPTPYLKVVPPAFVIQVVGSHPDARLFASFPDGCCLEALPFVPLSSRQTPLTLLLAISALDKQDLVSFIHY